MRGKGKSWQEGDKFRVVLYVCVLARRPKKGIYERHFPKFKG